MNEIPKYNSVNLVYFTGTNCTKKVTDNFKTIFDSLNIKCTQISITDCMPDGLNQSDLLILFSPVYAFRLASNFEKWISALTFTHNTDVAIISVSGGGEVSPNTACRVKAKRILKRKGYTVIYEDMFTMPTNFATPNSKDEIKEMLSMVPLKSQMIISEIMAGNKNILRPKFQDRIIAILGKAEHFGGKIFGRFLKAGENCNQCGLCAENCPTKNIKLKNPTVKFGFNCVWCMKCIYNCPKKAIKPGILKSVVLKDGFTLR